MKTCFKCNQKKDETEFYKHPQMGDGLLGKCKACTKRDVQQNYKSKREQYAEYYSQREHTESRKAWRIIKQRESRARDPQKAFARSSVSNAIRAGKLKRLPCVVCCSPKSEAHHPDYSKPLDVVWLCLKHHRETHGQTPKDKTR